MLKVNKKETPKQFIHYRTKENPKNWNDLNENVEIKKLLRTIMLHEEQNHYCPYCEDIIENEEKGRIEHIKPKDKFPNLMFEYTNLITSCNSFISCDQYKGNSWDENFIDPTKSDPDHFFEYNSFGEIIPIAELSELDKKKAITTIKILNLNHKSLTRSRRSYLKAMSQIQEINLLDSFLNFPSLVKYFRKMMIPLNFGGTL